MTFPGPVSQLFQRNLGAPLVTPDPMAGMAAALSPFGQLPGAASNIQVFPASQVDASETTTSATYTDLATVGPVLTGLPQGSYLVFFGALITGGPNSAYMGVKSNAVEATNSGALLTPSSGQIPASRVITTMLTLPEANTLTARYRADSSTTGVFEFRWMLAVRYSNL